MNKPVSQDSSAGAAPVSPVPWYRNPWIWGVLAGLIFVPAIRPFIRHIPDAPPVLATLPDYELHAAGTPTFKSSSLGGRVYVLGLFGPSCEPGCADMLGALEALSERFIRFERDITVVAGRLKPEGGDEGGEQLVATAPEPEAEWQLVEVQSTDFEMIAGRYLAPQFDELDSAGSELLGAVASQGRLFLVDALGNLRGHYGRDESGLDETYHRAQHVLRDHRMAGEVPR